MANGDASPDTVRSYRGEVACWVAWCHSEGFDPAAVTANHVKLYRQALVEGHYKPITIRWKLSIVRRFYEAARNAGLRLDNPVTGVKPPRVRHATEDFKYLCGDQLTQLLAVIPNPDKATGRDQIKLLRDLLIVTLMSLQALRTIEVNRANVEDLVQKGEHLTLLVRGKTRDRIAYLRPDTAARMKEYVTLRGEVPRDKEGMPLFTSLGIGTIVARLSRRHIRVRATSIYARLT